VLAGSSLAVACATWHERSPTGSNLRPLPAESWIHTDGKRGRVADNDSCCTARGTRTFAREMRLLTIVAQDCCGDACPSPVPRISRSRCCFDTRFANLDAPI
jgi:hypothetical protein